MATLREYEKMTTKERQLRYFSDEFKRKKVAEIDRNLTSIGQICREYQVSRTAVYKWIYKYSLMRKHKTKMVIETKSDTAKLQLLRDQIKELESIVGQKQIIIDFQQKMIDQAEQTYGIDIKKKYSTVPSFGTGKTGKDTTTK